MPELAHIEREIAGSGLVARGAFALSEADRTAGLEDVRAIVMVGTVGAQGWRAFIEAPEYRDGRADPLDRWSRRVIDALARTCGARALYPFGGPPYWPFQRWAMRAEPLHSSPLGLLIHPEYGLWHSYRGALAFAEAFPLPTVSARASPCDSCVGRPCLGACPVGAFTSRGYDVEVCAAHLRGGSGGACLEGGCLARRACPIGPDRRQGHAQAQFHMQAFLKARDSVSGQ
jgi:hypothetical protein